MQQSYQPELKKSYGSSFPHSLQPSESLPESFDTYISRMESKKKITVKTLNDCPKPDNENETVDQVLDELTKKYGLA
jgi:hypothetical protein